jgi:putative restriction endonuclease
MKYWIGVTDNGWYEYLSRAGVDEVNFWQPRGKVAFSGLVPGSPYLFKLKRPYNHIAGGGYFVKSTSLPLSIAWEAFGQKNGAQSRQLFESMIRKFINDPNVRDPEIGCTVLSSPFFWPRDLWIPDPAGFAGNIVRGRYYETSVPDEAKLWDQVQERLDGQAEWRKRHLVSENIPESTVRYGNPVLVKPRLGQGAFRVIVTDAYRRRCALTGESTLPVLEAAHILPFAEGGPHDISNGIFLRSDFHKLFDLGMITVTPTHHVEVSPKIRETWFNGKAYYRLHGLPLTNLPESVAERPSPEFLRWHNDNIFQP